MAGPRSFAAFGPTFDLLGGKVHAAEGPVKNLERRTYGPSRSIGIFYQSPHYYMLGDQTGRVSPEAYRALTEGLKDRLYYLPRSKSLVGIEQNDAG